MNRHRSYHERHAIEEEARLREIRHQLAVEEKAIQRSQSSYTPWAPVWMGPAVSGNYGRQANEYDDIRTARESVEKAILAIREHDNRRVLRFLYQADDAMEYPSRRYPAVESTRQSLELMLARWEPR